MQSVCVQGQVQWCVYIRTKCRRDGGKRGKRCENCEPGCCDVLDSWPPPRTHSTHVSDSCYFSTTLLPPSPALHRDAELSPAIETTAPDSACLAYFALHPLIRWNSDEHTYPGVLPVIPSRS